MGNVRLVYVLLGCLFMVMYTECSSRRRRALFGHWGYTEHDGNSFRKSNACPSTWSGVCNNGKSQSPINIRLESTVVKNFPSFSFDENYLKQQKFYSKNNGHTVFVSLTDFSNRPVIYGGGLGNKFIFEQLHFHWESEHEFDGKRADLEMHIVHYNSKYKNFLEASSHPDGIVVLAVIFNEEKETDNLLEQFFSHILNATSASGQPLYPTLPGYTPTGEKPEENSRYFALRDLLPKQVSRFFRYEGSLTTPGCDEVVQWTVFISRLPVSSSVLQAFRTLRDFNGNELTKNFRPPQKLNGREVYIQIKNDDGGPCSEFEEMNQKGAAAKALMSLPLLVTLIVLTS